MVELRYFTHAAPPMPGWVGMRVLQYRHHDGQGVELDEHGHVSNICPVWSEWKDVPEVAASNAANEGGPK